MQQNSKCRPRGEKYEKVDPLISECSKQAEKDQARLSGKSDLLGIVQEIKIWPIHQIVYTQTRISLREWNP